MREWGNKGAMRNVFWLNKANHRTRKACLEGKRSCTVCGSLSSPEGVSLVLLPTCPQWRGLSPPTLPRCGSWSLPSLTPSTAAGRLVCSKESGTLEKEAAGSSPATLSQPLPQSHLCLGACTGISLPSLDVVSTPFLKHGNPIYT